MAAAMEGYPTIVRTGSHDLDVQTVEQHRRAAAAQGITLFVQPLPGGGFQLSATAPPQPAVASTMPSNSPQHAQAGPARPSHAPVIAVQGASAAPGDPSGTLPSHFANFPYAAPTQAPRVEVILRPGEGYCEACHRVGPLRHATFMQNIGAIVLRFPRTVSGQLCKFCIDKYFFRFTAVTMMLGWWGVISFFYSLFAVPSNLVNWFGSFGMQAPQEDVGSLRDRRTRGSIGIAVGALTGALALLTLGLGALLATTGEDAGVVLLVIMGATMGFVASVILFFGIRARVRAGAGLRRLGAS
jgi:hypothetical protein